MLVFTVAHVPQQTLIAPKISIFDRSVHYDGQGVAKGENEKEEEEEKEARSGWWCHIRMHMCVHFQYRSMLDHDE